MKTRLLFSSVLFTFLSLLSSRSRAQNTTLSGHLKGLSGEAVHLFYIKDGISITDTVTATGDNFTWETNLELPVRVALMADSSNYYYFFAAPGKMRLTGIKDSLQSYVLTGSPMQQDADIYKTLTKDISRLWDSLFNKYKTASEKEKTAIDDNRAILKQQSDSIVHAFIASHPGSLFSMYLIGLENDYTTIQSLYLELDQTARQTTMGKNIAHRLDLLARRQIGQPMTDFTQADTSGKMVNFHKFKTAYKYILVDFWASWCAPCRAENPNVLKAYNAYKNKGFTVIGISLDDDANSWKTAIRQDKMPWTQLSDLNGWKNQLSTKLGIEFIPSNLLVDPSGKIIGKDLRGADLENKLRELMD